MPGYTTYFTLTLPTVGGDDSVWASYTNANWVAVDAAMHNLLTTNQAQQDALNNLATQAEGFQGLIQFYSISAPVGDPGSYTTVAFAEGLFAYDDGGSLGVGLSGIPAKTMLGNSSISTPATPSAMTVADIWSLLARVATPSIYSTNQNDLALLSLSTADHSGYRVSSTGAINFTGIVAPAASRVITLINTGANNITLKHENASSSAANRFKFAGGTDLVLQPDYTATILYDFSTARWRLVAKTP